MNDRRFAFGKNWQRYARHLGTDEISSAMQSLSVAVDALDTSGSTFLDIGSGSGLFSRAAYELGFRRIVSFDYDNDSVAATRALKEEAGASNERWSVEQGSVLDAQYMSRLGRFDVVYSWGVLHHTGAMWEALARTSEAVGDSGRLYIALYNDQGWISAYWTVVKRTYNALPQIGRGAMLLFFWTYFGIGLFLADVIRLRNPLKRHLGDRRGMRFFTDVIDWIGGYPFEVAKPEAVKSFLAARGFTLKWEKLVGRRHGCNEFVFHRMPAPVPKS